MDNFNSVSMVVPHRYGDFHRDRNWKHARAYYEKMMDGIEICVGNTNSIPYSKSEAVNDGVRKSTRNILIIADSDVLIDIDTLKEGIDMLSKYSFIIPYNKLVRLDKETTDHIISKSIYTENVYTRKSEIIKAESRMVGGIYITTKEDYKNIGGFDERFRGWGGEDDAVLCCVKHIYGSYHRLKGTLYHLYHEREHKIEEYRLKNVKLLKTEYLNSSKINETIKDLKEVNFSIQKINNINEIETNLKKKVSIITPCYNGEKFLKRYFDSILNQTYERIELIFINDGSTDNTEKIVKLYEPKLKNKYIEFKYIYKKNEGQASAINDGLKYFTGSYLTWPDSDDILEKDSISKKVEFLEKNNQYGLVRTDASMVMENDLNKVVYRFANRFNKDKEDIFEDLITEKMYLCCGCYMVRTSAFLDVNPDRKIYKDTRSGQNWQMLLPIAYKYKCGYIDEPLYIYISRENSHYHNSGKDYNSLLKRCNEHEDILLNTIKSMKKMSKEEKMKYIDMIRSKYIKKRHDLELQYKNHSH